jgi:hypothetical protein
VESANLDIVRSIYAAWERGDFSSTAWADPQITFVMVDGPSPGVWEGLASLAEMTRELLSAWDEWRYEVDEYRELDDERVLRSSDTGRAESRADWTSRQRARGALISHMSTTER